MISKRLPPNVQLLPYDTVLKDALNPNFPPKRYYLLPANQRSDVLRDQVIDQIVLLWREMHDVAIKVGESIDWGRNTAHGYDPNWLIRTWLPQGSEATDVYALGDKIRTRLPDKTMSELQAILSAFGVAVEEARARRKTLKS